MKRLWHRCFEDFLMPSRLDEYRRVLEAALDSGYRVFPIRDFWRLVQSGARPERYLLLRHDIDTDSATARAMWQIEHELGIQSSYYFRLSTVDVPLMRDIEKAGGEASYHYEEWADVIKRYRLKTAAAAQSRMPEARELFRSNLTRLRSETGLPMTVVASHGDFVNRQLQVFNWQVLSDVEFRREMAIELEVYDEPMKRHVTSRHSDDTYPRFLAPAPPDAAIASRQPGIYLLVHPRHWQSSPKENLCDNLWRCWQGFAFTLPEKRSAHWSQPATLASRTAISPSASHD